MITRKGVFGIVQGHANRPLAIDPRTGALLVGVGSSGNIGVEPEVKASIQRFEPDGSGQTMFASGLRNATGLAFHPDTGELYTVVQERDGMGDRLVPDFLTRVERGAFYGWPYAYIGPNPQPGFAQMRPDKVQALVILVCCRGAFLGDGLPVLQRRAVRRLSRQRLGCVARLVEPVRADGYQVVPVPFKDGRTEGYYENFVTGFWTSGRSPAEVLGRPAALAVTREGALLIADDIAGALWHVAYAAPAIRSYPLKHHRRRAAVRPRPAPVAPLPSSR